MELGQAQVRPAPTISGSSSSGGVATGSGRGSAAGTAVAPADRGPVRVDELQGRSATVMRPARPSVHRGRVGSAAAWCSPASGCPAPRRRSPDSTSAPALSTCTRAAIERTSARLWVTNSMLICRVFRRFSSSATIEPCTETSSAEVISSQTSRSGSAASARAMATRCRSPPESRLVCRLSTVGPSATASSSSTTRSRAGLALRDAEQLHRPARRSAAMVSRGFSDRYGFWKMYWIRLRSSADADPGALAQRAALERQLAGPLLVQPADAARDRGLAAAGLADQRDHLGLGHVEADPVHDLLAAVEHLQVVDGQDDVPVGVRVGVGGVAAVDVPVADLADAQALRRVVRADLDVARLDLPAAVLDVLAAGR